MILVLGGSGTIGTEVVNTLLDMKRTGQNVAVRIMVKDQDKAKKLFGDQVEIVAGDLNVKEDFEEAIKGIERLFLLTPSTPSQPQVEKRLIEQAQAAGVSHIVKLSVYGADASAESNNLIRWHGCAENHLIESGVPYTIIRPNNFFSNLGRDDSQSIKKEGKIYKCTGNAKISFVHPKDIGESIAIVLTTPIESHEHCTYNITGNESLTYSELAERVGKFLNKKVEYVDLPDDELYLALSKKLQKPFAAKMFIKLFEFYKRGGAAVVSKDFRILSGKDPRSWETYLEEHRSLFA